MPRFVSHIVALAAMIAAPAWSAPTPQTAPERVVLYSAPNFGGQAMILQSNRTDFVAGLTAKSARVLGVWQACAEAAYKGTCVTLDRDTPNLALVGLPNGVRSVRNALGPRPEAGKAGPSLKGAASEFFAAPSAQGKRVAACPTGALSANCARQEAQRFCAALGYPTVRSSAIEAGAGGVYLADVLCAKTSG